MTAFRQVVAKLQQGQREEASIGLEFVLRLDPGFTPALNLQRQLASGSDEIDLSGIVSDLQAPTTDDINEALVEAVEKFNQRRFVEAKDHVERVLLDLPGHEEARQLLGQIREALKVEAQVGQFLAKAQEALSGGDAQEAANFVMMAQALDPHHPGIDATLREVNQQGGQVRPPSSTEADGGGAEDELPISFETIDDSHAAFADFNAGLPDTDEPVATDTLGGDGPASQGSFDQPSTAADNLSPGSAFDAIPEADAAIPSASDFAFGAGDQTGKGDDLADLFEAEPEGSGEFAESPSATIDMPPEPGSDDDAERIHQLLEQGQEAFDRGDSQEAIDIWSRIYLIDPSHDLTTRRIDEARQRKDEVERRVEHMLYDAQEAAGSGETDRAVGLVEEILALQPNHIAAVELKEKLAGSAPEPPPADSGALNAALPELDDDLFSEELIDDSAAPREEPLLDFDSIAPVPTPTAGRRAIPWRLGVFALVGVVVVVLGIWFGSRLLSSDSAEDDMEAVNRMLAQAESLYKQGQVEEAVHLLQEFPASGLAQTRIARRLAKYQQSLAPPTPTPTPQDLHVAQSFVEEERWLAAYRAVSRGLQSHANDAGLLELKARLLKREPLLASLDNAWQRQDFRASVSIARELDQRYPDDDEISDAYERSLFNAAVGELRTYNLTGAEVDLGTLAKRRPDDEEVQRVLVFIDRYKARPVDMQLRVFIASLAER